MKNQIMRAIGALTIAAAIFAMPLAARATGLGLYGTLGTGSADIDVKPDSGGKSSGDGDMRRLGFGFVFDSNCAKKDLINYRLMVGFETVDLDPDKLTGDESFASYSIDNILGFGILTNPEIRLWAGPELRVAYLDGTGDMFTKDASSIVVGLGGVLGLNYHLGQDYDISFMAGVRNEWYNGSWEASPTVKGDFDGTGTYGFFTVSFLWRSLDDKYGAK